MKKNKFLMKNFPIEACSLSGQINILYGSILINYIYSDCKLLFMCK